MARGQGREEGGRKHNRHGKGRAGLGGRRLPHPHVGVPFVIYCCIVNIFSTHAKKKKKKKWAAQRHLKREGGVSIVYDTEPTDEDDRAARAVLVSGRPRPRPPTDDDDDSREVVDEVEADRAVKRVRLVEKVMLGLIPNSMANVSLSAWRASRMLKTWTGRRGSDAQLQQKRKCQDDDDKSRSDATSLSHTTHLSPRIDSVRSLSTSVSSSVTSPRCTPRIRQRRPHTDSPSSNTRANVPVCTREGVGYGMVCVCVCV